MPKHYTDADKRLVLDRLIANRGDVARTAAEYGINERTIYVWRKDSKFADMLIPNLQNLTNLANHDPSSSPPSLAGEGLGEGVSSLPPETTEAFQALHDKLLTIANTLAYRIEEAIDEAPLNQRMTALSQLISSISKLATLLPTEEETSGKFEIDYDVQPKEDNDDEDETQSISPSARSASVPEDYSRKYSPF